jgi:hypothetical protein
MEGNRTWCRWGAAIAAIATIVAGSAPAAAQPVTFYRDVAPILQRNCQECHRPGEIGPMPLLTYDDARRAASRISEMLTIGKMPPWFADPGVNRYANDRTLPPADAKTIMTWIDSGAPAGNPKDAPPPRAFVDGWAIGQPDFVIGLPQPFKVPAHGTIEYQFVVLPLGFTEDKWVQAVEIRPGNRAVVHHVRAMLREPGSKWLAEVPPGVMRPKRGESIEGTGLLSGNGSLGSYTPGQQPIQFRPGRAMLVPAGSDLVLEIHYTTNGKAAEDLTHVGFVFAKQRPTELVRRFAMANTRFAIPPGDANYQVAAAATLRSPVRLISIQPHMHLRGRSAEVTVAIPNGGARTVLRVSHYDPLWQLHYDLADELELPYGTRIDTKWGFDNSRHHYNPDPTATVRWGDQTWEEMALMSFDAVVPMGTSGRLLTSASSR